LAFFVEKFKKTFFERKRTDWEKSLSKMNEDWLENYMTDFFLQSDRTGKGLF